jgi:hypothetical protein
MMETVIQVIGWAGLVFGVLGAVAVLKLALLTLRVLRQIDKLVRLSRDAAEGLLVNLRPHSRLPAAVQAAEALAEESAAIAVMATNIERELLAAGRRGGAEA